MNTLKQIYALLTPSERRQLFWLAPVVVLMALAEVVGVASVMPFLALLSQPDAIQSNALLAWAYELFDFRRDTSFLIFVGVCVLLVLTLSNAFTLFVTWLLARFTWLRNHSVARRLLAGYLWRPYSFFLNRNTSEISATLFSEVREVILNILVPLVRAAARLVAAVFILLFLVIVDPLLALITFSLLGGAYGGIFLALRRTLARLGKARVTAQRESYRVAGEALGGIKDVKVLAKEEAFLTRFSDYSKRFADATATGQAISFIPRYALEVIAFGGLLVIILYYLVTRGSAQDVLPVLGLYALASYRLLPALQSVFETVSMIQVSGPMLDTIVSDLRNAQQIEVPDSTDLPGLAFDKALRLEHLSYSYPETSVPVLQDINLTIKPGSSVAFVGTTGSGKTTIVDLILGLLTPSGGNLRLDDTVLSGKALFAWQRKLGYVPQSIYISDDTLARNIALGLRDEQIDRSKLGAALRAADLQMFVDGLPDGLETYVGERGVRMSGGQRQRLGIARALYFEPEVLILDEATSALDNVTEASVLASITKLGRSKTLITIAHRLSTVENCDEIFMLEGGRLIARGSYQDLLRESKAFAALARRSEAKETLL